MSATANIFVGQTEAPLVVKPYIAGMTQSELFVERSEGWPPSRQCTRWICTHWCARGVFDSAKSRLSALGACCLPNVATRTTPSLLEEVEDDVAP